VKKSVSWTGAAVQRELERRSWRISNIRSRYQETACENTTCENTTDWKALIVCCGDLKNVEISGGAVSICISELRVWMVNKSNM
jgi:hypothetical protein